MIHQFNNHFENIIKQVYKEKYDFQNELHNLHYILNAPSFIETKEDMLKLKVLGKNDRESIFYESYHTFIDTNKIFNDVYCQFINDYIKPMFSDGGSIVIQKTPNIRISFPNSTAIGKREQETGDDIIGLHKDADFGHHEDEINIVIPITNMFDTNSIYYEPVPYSNEPTDSYINLKLNTDEFFVGEFNKLLHYNRINTTGVTRISLDLRVIRYDDYMRNIKSFENTKFELGKYYIII